MSRLWLTNIQPRSIAYLKPGSKFRYSGGGYVILQQLMMDVTGISFSRIDAENAADQDMKLNRADYEFF